MEILSQTFNSGRQGSKQLNIVHTTLYDLIAAINEDVLPKSETTLSYDQELRFVSLEKGVPYDYMVRMSQLACESCKSY